eukprot:scaffold24140_cov76-Skeletonema_marinoi.AAC.2
MEYEGAQHGLVSWHARLARKNRPKFGEGWSAAMKSMMSVRRLLEEAEEVDRGAMRGVGQDDGFEAKEVTDLDGMKAEALC